MRSKVAAALAVAVAAALTAFLVVDRDGGQGALSIGPEGGTESAEDVTVAIPPGAVSKEASLRIQRVEGGASKLLPEMRALAPVHSIELGAGLRRPAQVRFALDGARGGPVYVATRETVEEMWTLRRARLIGSGEEAVIATRGFSFFQPLEDLTEKALAGATTATATLLRLGGVRASEPRCAQPPFGYELEGDVGTDDSNALVFACLEASGEEMSLHIVDNRAIGMEYARPRGLRVTSLTSPDLPDELMDAVRDVQGDSTWRSISATGEVVLSGRPSQEEIAVEPTLRSFAFDLAVFAIGQAGGKLAKAAAVTNYLECVREAAGRLRAGVPKSAGEAMDAALGVWRRCGDTLAAAGGGALAKLGAVFFGGMKLGTGATDAVAELLGEQRAELRVTEAPPAVLAFSAEGAVEAVGAFSVSGGARTIADAAAAFGEPATVEPGPTGCELTWPELGLKADAVNYSGRDLECTPDGGYINDFIITSDLFQTEAGLRVGMSEDELLARHPDATTKGGDPRFDDDLAPAGSLYGVELMASPIPVKTGVLQTLKALVRNGEVVGFEVTPLLGGD
jgi:hypothetical protein